MSDHEERQLACAYLSTLGWSQDEIATRLTLHQTAVSRELSSARKAGLLVSALNWPRDADRVAITSRGDPDLRGLHEHLRRWSVSKGVYVPRDLHIIDVTDGTSGEELAQEFGRRAAVTLGSYLEASSDVAVAWGRTLNAVLDRLAPHVNAQRADIRSVFPVSGEPLNYPAGGGGTTAATERVAHACDVPPERRLSLQGIPARIPADLVHDADAIKRFVNKSRDYERIFESGGLLDNADTILTGIGDTSTSGTSNDAFYRETEALGGVTNLSAISIGNLSGVWQPSHDASDGDREALRLLNERWLGIQGRHLTQCHIAAEGDPKRPGVVVVAAEPEKTLIVKAALGMITRLIISRPLAAALMDLAASETAR